MAQGRTHAYHIVDPSPWPLMAAFGAFVMAIGAIGLFRWRMREPFELIDRENGAGSAVLDCIDLGRHR